MKSVLERIKCNENYFPALGSKIAVCMSGGVDSSTSAYLLTKKGYEVIGLTGWLIKGQGRCCDNGMIDAAKVCKQIGIQHIAQDLRIFFKQEIIDPFIGSYSEGSTPVPCITCNTMVKWGALMQYALNELGCTHIATGHYAKLTRCQVPGPDTWQITRPKDTKKDQTYMLWGLTQEVLSQTVFPLGDLTKEEVREIAKEGNLIVADKEESQDICFVSSKENTQGFLSKHLQEKEGPVVESTTGKIIGTHKGTYNFTIGQRKGLGISHSEPLYVTRLDADKNIVYVGTKDKLKGFELIVKDVNWINPSVIARNEVMKQSHNELMLEDCFVALQRRTPRYDTLRVMAKVRYNAKTSPAKVELLESNKARVTFDAPVMAITPGQACVFYDESDQILLGGGWIS